MREITKAEAVKRHREMWNWIAEKTLERKKRVTKNDYFVENNSEIVALECFCCEYIAHLNCSMANGCPAFCPIFWDEEGRSCVGHRDSLFTKWDDALDCEEAAYYAKCIANLPERPDGDFDIIEAGQR